MTIKTGRCCDDLDLPSESPGRRGNVEIRVTKNVGKIEPTFACQPFGVNGKPATWASIQDVPMVNVTVKDGDILWFCE